MTYNSKENNNFQHLFFFHTALPTKHNLVYSYLCWRHNIGESVSEWELRCLGFCPLKTIPRILKDLKTVVAIDEQGRYTPLPLPAEKVRLREVKEGLDEKEFWKTYAYYDVRLPQKDCPLTMLQNLAYWLLVSLNTKPHRQNYKGLAIMLHCSHRSASRAVKRLEKLKLIERRHLKNGSWQYAINDVPDNWYRYRRLEALPVQPETCKPEPKPVLIHTDPKSNISKVNWTGHFYREIIQSVIHEDLNDKWLQEVFAQTCDNIIWQAWMDSNSSKDCFLGRLADLYSGAKTQHAKTGKARHCGYIFLDLVKKHYGGCAKETGFLCPVRRFPLSSQKVSFVQSEGFLCAQ